MSDSCRQALQGVSPQPSTHAGLWLDRFAANLGKKSEGAAQAHFDKLKSIEIPPMYGAHFARWRQMLLDLDPEVRLAKATVRGRMVVGLGAESVFETSITLHRTYGVPVIPGSALKGLASATARRLLADEKWQAGHESHAAMFGDQKEAGHVTFHDALWIPGPPTAAKLPLELDVMTVHHPAYYGGKDEPAADWDSPIPVSFVTAQGAYLLAVSGPDAWAEAAMDILKHGLDRDGIGAKTAAGYGRMDVDVEKSRAKLAREERAKEQLSLTEKMGRLKKDTAGSDVPAMLAKVTGADRRDLAVAIVAHLRRTFGNWLAEKADKAWAKQLHAACED